MGTNKVQTKKPLPPATWRPASSKPSVPSTVRHEPRLTPLRSRSAGAARPGSVDGDYIGRILIQDTGDGHSRMSLEVVGDPAAPKTAERMALITPMNEAYLRPRKILETFSRLYPGAWRQADDFRANRKERGGWPDWCFLPLAGAYAIVSKGTTLKSINQTRHVGILGTLAAWRVTQGIYRFDPTTFEALCETPVTGDIPTEVLFRLPEWCVYIPTPDRRWGGDTLHGFFAHLEHDTNDRRVELRFVLDLTKPEGEDLAVLPLHLGQGGVSAGVAAMMQEAGRHLPVGAELPDSEIEGLADEIYPLVSLLLYLCSQAAEIWNSGDGRRVPARPQLMKTKKGMRLFAPDRPTSWEVGYRLGAALRKAWSTPEAASDTPGNHASPRPHIRRAHWHSYWVGPRSVADARSVVLKWLPPIPVNVQDVEELTLNQA